eukprot:gene16307-7694_t
MAFFSIILALFVFQCIDVTNGKSDSKYVRINVDAKWPSTPLVLEASEFIGTLDDGKFWEFIESFNNSEAKENTLGIYNSILDASSKLLADLEMDMMKFSLSLRSFSPLIQVYRQLLRETDIPDCEVLFLVEDKLFCDFDELATYISSTKNGSKTTVHTFDHVYPGTDDNSVVVVVLYGAVGSSAFLQAHNSMKGLANSGKAKYIFRHYLKDDLEGKVHLSGYGVELAVKSTEYKAVDDQKVEGKDKGKEAGSHHDDEDEVEGFLFNRLRDKHPEFVENLDNFRSYLKESTKELAPLKVWQLQDLSFQAAQRIMSSSPDQRLKVLRDISQNIPMLARSLVKTSVKEELRNEIKDNQRQFQESHIDVGEAAVFINGIQVQVDSIDGFSLEKLLMSEMVTMKQLGQLGLKANKAREILTLDVKPQHDGYAVDTRSESVQWLNNLEKDSQYHYWPSNIEEILRPTFPGMLRYIAKNIFHVVLCIDPADEEGIKKLHQFQDFVSNSMPARFGVLFVAKGSPSDDGMTNAPVALMRAFSFIKSEKDVKQAFDFIIEVYRRSERKAPSAADITDLFKRWYGADDLKDAMSPNTDFDDLRENSYRLFQRLGLKGLPQIIVNGHQLNSEEMQNLEQSLIEKFLSLTPEIQQATYMGQIHNHPTIYDYVMSKPNVVKRLNSMVQTTEGPYLDVSVSDKDLVIKDKEDFTGLQVVDIFNAVVNDVKYFLTDRGAVTTWVVADADTVVGRQLIRSALNFIIKDSKTTRLALVLCPGKEPQGHVSLNHIVQSIIETRETMVSGVAKLILAVLDESNNFENLANGVDAVMELANTAKGFNKKRLSELLQNEESKVATNNKLVFYRNAMEKTIRFSDRQAYVVCNGRVIGPFEESNVLSTDDFDLLQSFELKRASSKINNAVSGPLSSVRSDMIMRVSAILSSHKQIRRTKLKYHDLKHSVISIAPVREDKISYDVVAVLDPLSTDAQKIVPILMVLVNITNVNLNVFFNCKEKLSEMPLKRSFALRILGESRGSATYKFACSILAKQTDPAKQAGQHVVEEKFIISRKWWPVVDQRLEDDDDKSLNTLEQFIASSRSSRRNAVCEVKAQESAFLKTYLHHLVMRRNLEHHGLLIRDASLDKALEHEVFCQLSPRSDDEMNASIFFFATGQQEGSSKTS